ncbi:MAG: hypothetical protein WCT42_00960 [Candidatus Paceibacterota bacterium]
MKRYFFPTLIIIFTILSLPAYAETEVNSGFIPGQIWYSKLTLIEGETVNIHTAVWNGEKDLLSAKIEFYDKNVILGSRDVTLKPLELKDIYIPWKITSGDHVISAKIISSISTISGKKEKVVPDRSVTSLDRQFVSVIAKDSEGAAVGSSDSLLKDQIDKTTSEINKIIPEKVSTSVSKSFTSLDDLRDKTFTQVDAIKKETKEEIASIINKEKAISQSLDKKASTGDGTEKPIAYIKLFLFGVLSFVFGNKIIFYGLLLFIVFYIIRAIYRKIRNR